MPDRFVIPSPTPGPFTIGPDGQRQDGVPQGTVSTHQWRSTVFPGTLREYYVYVPSQYDGKEPKDFSPSTYRSLHADLSHLDDRQAAMHFARYGMNEGRRYQPDQKKVFHPTLKNYLEQRGLGFLFRDQLIPVAD